MDGVEALIAWSGDQIGLLLPEGILRSLLIEGVWGGVGSVVVFLPQILLLFLFLGILEDSGYLARAAVIADRTMSRVGLQGKAFIPLLSAYACAVPAIMATRTIEDKRDRLATVLIAPFMTCSARLPVYTLLIAAFVPDTPLLGGFLGLQAAVLLGLYILGFAAAVGTALLLRSSVLRHAKTTFVMELPAYRRPSLRSLLLRLLDRAVVFLQRAGSVILCVSVLLWVLAHLPYKDGKAPPLEQSIAGQIGRAVEPAIQPLGFNWKIGIGLITSLAAREVIVGTLGTIYGIENAEQDSPSLIASLRKDLTPGGAFALMIFFAFAMQCFSTVAIVRRELGSWIWPAAQFFYMAVLAYLGALATNQIWLRLP
jgi:ferrous iron transport protein B